MSNLKKMLVLVVVFTMMLTAMLPAFTNAAVTYSYEDQAAKLHDLGLYKGTSNDVFTPDLGGQLTREQGVAMLLRLFGKESDALKMTSQQIKTALIVFSDVDEMGEWAKPYIAYAVDNKMVTGNPNGTFNPQGQLLGRDYCTMLLRAMGYAVDANAYTGAAFFMKDLGGLTYQEAAKFNEKGLIRDDLVGISYASMSMPCKDGETVVSKLIKAGVLTEAKAISAGVYFTDLNNAATAAVNAFLNAPYSTNDEITAAAKLKASAEAIFGKYPSGLPQAVQDKLDAFKAQIADQQKNIDAQKAKLDNDDATSKANLDAADAALKDYEAAPLTSLTEAITAEALGQIALVKINYVTGAKKDEFMARYTARKDAVSNAKAKFTPATAVAEFSNLQAIKVTFNKTIDAATITADTVKVTGYAVSFNLLNDKKTLYVVLPSALQLKTQVTLNISGVKDTDGIVATAVTDLKLTADDTAVPVFVSGEAADLNTITAYYNEPVNASTDNNQTTSVGINGVATVKANGEYLYGKFTSDPTKNSVTLHLPAGSALSYDTDYTISIADVRDMAGFAAAEGTFQVKLVKDTAAPAIVDVKVLSATTFDVYFDEPVFLTATTGFALQEVGLQVNTWWNMKSQVVNPDGKSVRVTLPDGLHFTPNAYEGFTVLCQNLADKSGNKNSNAWFVTKIDKAADNMAVDIAFTKVANNVIGVEWSTLQGVPMTTADGISVPLGIGLKLSKNDEAAAAANVTWSKPDPANKPNYWEITLNTVPAVQNDGTAYSFTIQWPQRSTITGNLVVSSDKYFDWSTTDNLKPSIASSHTYGDVVELNFDDTMDTASLSNIGNYYIGLTGVANDATIPLNTYTYNGTKASIKAATDKSVQIIIPGVSSAADLVLAAYNVKDSSGNLMDQYTVANPYDVSNVGYATFNPNELVAAAINSNTIEISAAIDSIHGAYDKHTHLISNASLSLDSVVFKDSTGAVINNALGIKAVNVVNGKIVVTFFNALSATATLNGKSIVLSGFNVPITDQNGIALSSNNVGAAVADKIAPVISNIDLGSGAQAGLLSSIKVTLSESVKYLATMNTDLFAPFIEVKTTDGTVLTATLDYTISTAITDKVASDSFTVNLLKKKSDGSPYLSGDIASIKILGWNYLYQSADVNSPLFNAADFDIRAISSSVIEMKLVSNHAIKHTLSADSVIDGVSFTDADGNALVPVDVDKVDATTIDVTFAADSFNLVGKTASGKAITFVGFTGDTVLKDQYGLAINSLTFNTTVGDGVAPYIAKFMPHPGAPTWCLQIFFSETMNLTPGGADVGGAVADFFSKAIFKTADGTLESTDVAFNWIFANNGIQIMIQGGHTPSEITDIIIPAGTATVLTDLAGNSTKGFVNDLPVITLSDYSTDPTNGDITVTATTSKGTLNAASHTFTENGSFTFTATDMNGNSSSKKVTITNIDKTAPQIVINEALENYTDIFGNKIDCSNLWGLAADEELNVGDENENVEDFVKNLNIIDEDGDTLVYGDDFDLYYTDESLSLIVIEFLDGIKNTDILSVAVTKDSLLTDLAGNQIVKTTVPTITLSDYSTDPTNEDITVTATVDEGTLNETSHTFTANGSFTFIATNDAGNKSMKTVTITNIDKTAPVITIADYTTDPTNDDIVVTASTDEGDLNAASHTFTANGSFDFVATDDAGNVTTTTITIDNIDKVAPKLVVNEAVESYTDEFGNVVDCSTLWMVAVDDTDLIYGVDNANVSDFVSKLEITLNDDSILASANFEVYKVDTATGTIIIHFKTVTNAQVKSVVVKSSALTDKAGNPVENMAAEV